MKISIPSALLLLMTAPAFASQSDCEGIYGTSGQIRMTCKTSSCSVDVLRPVSHPVLNPQQPKLENCTGTRRNETRAKMYQVHAYYDMDSKDCWADYIRIPKKPSETGHWEISLVEAGSGDHHDYSGYQYAWFECTQNPLSP